MRKNKLFKSAHVPLRVCFKLAMKNVWKKKFRFLTVILICSISLAFLSFTIELNGDKLRQNVYTMIENGYNYTTIKEHLPLDKEAEKENYYNKYNSTELSVNSYDNIKSSIDDLIIHKYENVRIKYADRDLDVSTEFYTGYINTLIQYDSSNDYQLVAGRLPNENAKEILITDYLVSAFNYFDVYMEHGSSYDYLYKYLKLVTGEKYQIVGVVDTNYENWTEYSGFRNLNIDDSDKTNYPFYNDYIFMNAVIIPENYFSIEKVKTSKNIVFTKNSDNRAEWLINAESNTSIYNYIPEQLSFNLDGYEIASKPLGRWRYETYGTVPTQSGEIAIPQSWLEKLYGISYNSLSGSYWSKNIQNTTLSIALSPQLNDDSYFKSYKVVGIVASDTEMLIHEDDYNELNTFTRDSEKILVELPNDSSAAYSLFQDAYDEGYIIDVWGYQTDIDSYTVDPFIDIFSKAGLIVFVAFTIGIMWTIITIEIVDSKKEIGILRSIGLSGMKTSLIFIIQALFVSLVAYIISIFLANYVITFYNSGITDELGVITLFMYTMTYRTPLYLLIFVLVITGISTILPLYKIMSQKIIDVINERE